MIARCAIALMVTCAFCSCEQNPTSTAGADAEYQRQIEIFDEQTSRMNTQLDQADEFLARQEAQAERYDALLDRWEKQADREDRLHDALEKWLTDRPTGDPE